MILQALVEFDDDSDKEDDDVERALREVRSRVLPTDLDDPRSTTAAPESVSKARKLRDAVGEITAVLRKYQKRSSARGSGRVLRLERNYAESPPSSVDERTSVLSDYLDDLLKECRPLGHADIAVIYEQDGQFIPLLDGRLAAANPSPFDKPKLIIAMATRINEEATRNLCKMYGEPPSPIVLVTAAGLREMGLNIIEYGSIEKTVRDVVGYITTSTGPLRGFLDYCGHLIIGFEDADVIYIRHDSDRGLIGSYYSCPNFDAVARANPESFGRTPGGMAVMVAAVTRQVYQAVGTSDLDLGQSLRLAVAANTLQFCEGYRRESPFNSAEKALSWNTRRRLRGHMSVSGQPRRNECLVSALTFPATEAVSHWSRLDAWRSDLHESDVEQKLREIVRYGAERAFRKHGSGNGKEIGQWWPAATITCPYHQVGTIKTVDPEKINGLLALGRLLRDYLDDRTSDRPLSLAVFGQPGTGKSTAARELFSSLQPSAGKLEPPLTFNLAQFDKIDQLTEAFHRVQDRALSSKLVPLVIFDEFDCNFGEQQLGWLKYFLAPMQDGEFTGRSGRYRVPRAVFVFVGGTSPSFEVFSKGAVEEQGSKPEDLKRAKLTDFTSRLLGHLNMRDINPPEEPCESSSQSRQIQWKVKRALTLRFLLEKHMKERIATTSIADDDDVVELDVAEPVIDAFLGAPRYVHGVRSLEAVVRMSRAIDGKLLVASFPAESLLDMHAPGILGSR